MGELELDHAIISKLALGGKAATTSKAMIAVGALKASLLAHPFGWLVMITAASVAATIVLRENAVASTVEGASKV